MKKIPKFILKGQGGGQSILQQTWYILTPVLGFITKMIFQTLIREGKEKEKST